MCIAVFVCIDVFVYLTVCVCIAVFECLCVLLSCPVSCLVAKVSTVHNCVAANKSSRQFSTHGRYFPPDPPLSPYHLQTHFLFLQNAQVVFPGPKTETIPGASSNKLLLDHKLPKEFARNLGINIHFLDLTNQRLRVCLFQSGFYSIISASGIVKEMQYQQS